MSDKSDDSVSPIIHKGKRKTPLLTDSEEESDSSVSDLNVTVPKRSGKRKNRIRESDSDSSIEKSRKLKRVPRVTSDSGSSNSDASDIVKTKKPARVVSDDSSNSDSDTDVSGATDNGFEDNTSDEWESDWISESEIDQSQNVNNNEKKDSTVPAASTSINLGNISDSSDGESEKCPICLLSFNTQEVGTPETCDHSFCADCIQEWSKNVNTCPVDRQTFTLILVRKRYNGKVIRTVPVDVRRPSVDELIQEDPTFCEICGMSDREDRLLLCDGCDLGYHLECLDPPMDTVPIEEWFCSNCRRDESHQHSQRGHRGEYRLLPRTMQSERIRATIETNRNNSAFNVDQQSLSSGFEDVAMPGPSRTSSARNRSRNTAPTRKHKQKRNRRTYKKKKRASYSVIYDICEVTGEKIAIKKKRRTKKRTKRKAKRSTRRVVKPKTVKKRLAYQLGMCPLKKAGLAVPEVKSKANGNSGNIGYQRSQAGIPTLHLFGQRDQLDYFSESDDEATVSSSGGGMGIMTQIRSSIGNMGSMRRAARRKTAVLSPVAPISVNSIDILSSILDSQEKLHSKNSVISVSRDGTLRIEQNEHLRNSEKNNNDIVKPNSEVISQNSPLDITSTGEIETTQAPMFPGRGGGGNRQPYGFHNRGGYRGGDNRYDGGSGGGYNHFQGGGPRGRGGYGQNMYNQRDNNFGGGYMNFHHHGGGGGPPPPFRGRGGPRFPTRRPQLHQQQPQEVNQREEPVELNLDEPMEQNVSDDQSRQQEEDVDIYSDIEAGTPVPDDEVTHTKPMGEPEPTLVSQAYNNSGTDDDSGSELVIDDSVKDTDKYDPTQPSADTDSNSEPPLHLIEPEPPKEDLENINTPTEQLEEPEHEENNENSVVELTIETPKITSFSTEAVAEAVQQVIKEHLSTPTKSNDNDDDDDDALDDEDCPNFSIYSSTSIDIAKSSEISVDIPKQDDNIEVQTQNENLEPEIKAVTPQIESESQSKDPSWESGDEWDAPEAETNLQTFDKPDTEQPLSPHEQDDPDEKDEPVAEGDDLKDDEASVQPEEEKDAVSETDQSESKDQADEIILAEIDETVADESDKLDTAELSASPEYEENNEDDDESPKPDSIAVEVDQFQVRESTTPPLDALPAIPLPEDKEKPPIKIAFTPGKKYQPDNNKKERVLQLYDDSDWEEWESKNEVDKAASSTATENVTTELEKMTEAISEEERSYTPCLDEREPMKCQFSDEERNIGVGIGGMDTELISDEERNDIFDESHDMKTISDGDALEINAKESELDMTRPEDYEEGEIIEKLGAKKAQESQVEVPKQSGSEDDKSKKRVKKKPEKEPEKSKPKETDKQAKKPEFKKISKSNKDRNYRDKEKARSKSKERKDKENKENRKEDRKKKERKRDLERYNVRSIIAEKPKKDQFGRDIKSPSHSSRSASPRRSRSHSWNRAKRRRRRSRSVRRSRSRSGSRGHTPRSRSRGKTPRRSRSLRRSRSPRRSRSKSFRRSRSPRNKRHRLEYRSSSRDRDRSRRYRDRSRRRSNERLRNKKKNRSLSRTRLRTRTPSLSKHRIRGEWARSVDEPRRQSYTREWTPSWSRSPTPPRPVPRHNLPQSMSPSWTPPLIEKGPVQPENLTVILTNNEVNKTKKKEKKKKGDKKSKDEYRKRKRGDRTPPPSKEVFASGDNILVSVSFNKTNEENAVATREVTGVKRKRDETIKKKKDKIGEKKKKRAKSPRTKKKNKEIANLKPVAIIDLDRSPFKEITPSPKDIIVLSDSDNCEKEDETMGHHDMMQEELMSLSAQIQEEDSAPQSPTANYLNSTGPKTPPEPQIKFLLTSKQTQLRQINNPLHDPNDENEPDIDPQEELEHRLDDVLHKGPNTPPEPPSSPPSSPDAYDPFDPTKSRSPTPEPPADSQPINSAMNTPEDKTESDGDLVDLAVGPLESSQKSTGSLNETSEKRSGSLDRTKRLSSSPERTSQTLTPPVSSSDQPAESSDSNKNDAGDKNSKSPERNNIGVVINQQVQPAVVKPIIPTPSVITSTPAVPNVSLPRTNLFNTPSSVSGTPRIPASVPQRIILPTPAKSSPAKMSPLKTSPSKPPIKSTPIKPMPSKTMISKLPVPNMKPITPVRKGPQTKAANRNVGQNGNEIIDVDLDFESPYSPGSSDYEDLFEPPTEGTKNNNSSRATGKNTKSPAKQANFDNLFGSSPVFRQQNNKTKSKTNAAKIPVKMNKKSTPTKAGTKTVGVKIDEDNLKILDDLPNSAVEMQVKDKFLKKLNRQERVVEEVKLVLKPHYNKKHVTKEQYKDILRRAVPKICHNRSGEINPKKIQNLIEAYVKKARHAKKAATGGATTNAGAATQQPKPAKTTFWS